MIKLEIYGVKIKKCLEIMWTDMDLSISVHIWNSKKRVRFSKNKFPITEDQLESLAGEKLSSSKNKTKQKNLIIHRKTSRHQE